MGGVIDVVKTAIEIPIDEYVKIVLLVVEGKYPNLKQVIRAGLQKLFEEYGEEYFREAMERNKDVVENIMKNAKIIKRKRVRKWVVTSPQRR